MKCLPLPGWLLVLFSMVFIFIWFLAPEKSFSGHQLTLEQNPHLRGSEQLTPVLQVKPEFPPSPLPRGPVETVVEHRPWEVAFTFDDGPHHIQTPRLLKILDQHNVKATFFVNGCWLDQGNSKSTRNLAVLKSIFEQGHTIGNHSYSHPNFFKISEEMQTWEVLTNERVIFQTIGIRPMLFRVPYAVKVERFRPLLKKLGYVIAKWNASAPDDENNDPEQLRNIVMGWIRHNQGGIVMLHDRHKWSVDATALILKSLEQENCRRLAQRQNTFKIVSLSSFLMPPEKSHTLLATNQTTPLFCKEK